MALRSDSKFPILGRLSGRTRARLQQSLSGHLLATGDFTSDPLH
jgi:hypothetical protein